MSADPGSPVQCDEHHCITCGDEGVPMTVLELEQEPGLALCSDAHGERSSVEVALVEPVASGDSVLVHAGVALVRLDSVTVAA